MIDTTFRYFTTILVASTLTTAALTQPCEFEFGKPENLGPVVNSAYKEGGSTITADGLTLIFHTSRPPGSNSRGDLWVTTRPTILDPWEAPVNLGSPVNTSSAEWCPSISSDGLILVIDSDRPGGAGLRDVWMSTRPSVSDPWDSPVNLGSTVNSSSGDMCPDISADGLIVLFFSRRPGGLGEADLWMTTRASMSDPWESPVNLGAPVNSSHSELNPNLSPDGLVLFFNSDRPGGPGIWKATRASVSDPWEPPVFLPPSINAGADEAGPNFWAENSTLLFRSRRSGGEGHNDLWQVPVIQHCECVRDPAWVCDGDVDGDGWVNQVDAGLVMAAFGLIDEQSLCNYDIDCDEQINPVDAGIVLSLFGTCEAPRDVCP